MAEKGGCIRVWGLHKGLLTNASAFGRILSAKGENQHETQQSIQLHKHASAVVRELSNTGHRMNLELLFHLLILFFLVGTGAFTLGRAHSAEYKDNISDTFYMLFALTYVTALIGQIVSIFMAVLR